MSEKDNKLFLVEDTLVKAWDYTRFFVLTNSGTIHDVEDVFQEAVSVFIEKFRKGEITLKSIQ